MRFCRITLFLCALCFASRQALAQEPPKPPATPIEQSLQKANALFKAQNFAEARTEYDHARDMQTDWRAGPVRLAVEGGVASSFRLKLWDEAIARATQYVEKTRNSFEGARGERYLAGLYLIVPHYGTKRGRTFLRGERSQGVQVSSWRKDRQTAITHYERARELLRSLQNPPNANQSVGAQYLKALVGEQIGVDFDLAGTLSQQAGSRYSYRYNRWGWIGWWWGDGWDVAEDSEAVDEADYDEPRYGYWGDEEDNTPPTGIPLDNNGRPQFIEVPARYSADLGDGPKIRFLLDEIQKIDPSETKDDAAKALFRWAMIARSLYGSEAATQWNQTYLRTNYQGRPMGQDQATPSPTKRVWELEENESLTLAGGTLRVVPLPPSESPVALLGQIAQKYPRSKWVPEAGYARGLYFQTRQQFPQAVAAYRALIASFPTHQRAKDATTQISLIENPGVALEQGGVNLPGKARLAFSYRNTSEITFKATRVDLTKYVQDSMETIPRKGSWNYANINYNFFYNDPYSGNNEDKDRERWKRYLGKEAATWKEAVPPSVGNRVARGSTLAPLAEPGAYVVETSLPGRTEVSRVLILVTDIAIVQKNLAGKGLIWVADAITGQPLPDKAVRIYEHWHDYNLERTKDIFHWDSVVLNTNKDGIIEYKRRNKDVSAQVDSVVLGEDGRLAFSFFQSWSESDGNDGIDNTPRYYAMTDRPVYRPSSLVKFRIWTRQRQDGQYQRPKAGENVGIRIYDAKRVEVKTLTLKTDDLGGVSGEYELGEEPPLGVYSLTANGYSAGLFRVEEYKKPEYEVSVKPAKAQARLGEKISARIQARYYFGAPVASATVSYKVFRENYTQVYWGEGEYDWLYGAGYGRYLYAYPWLPWWNRWGSWSPWEDWSYSAYPYPGWGGFGGGFGGAGYYRSRAESGTRKALRELVAQGTAKLKPDGTYDVEIDTSRMARGQSDQRYTVEADVRDASRRTISGEGSVLATRQQFSAFVETDGGWYQPNREAFVKVRTLTPDGVPVAAQGEVVVSRITNATDGNAVSETEVKRWKAQTDADGRLSFTYPIPGEGQYRVSFRTSDSWKQEVQGNAVFWVNGPKFEGRVYRFNELEVIADKRTYKVGDTAHLLINTAQDNARVLWSDEVGNNTLRSYRFLDIKGHSQVIEVPITARRVPNFFVEATLIRDGSVHTEAQQLFVPPVQGLLNVKLQTDKPSYRAGDKGHVQISVTDADGKPVSGQMALTAYDQSVTYIQDEMGPSPRLFFYGQKRSHTPMVDSSFNETFGVTGGMSSPELGIYAVAGPPESWTGSWQPEIAGTSLSDIYGRRDGGQTHFAIGPEFGSGGFGGGGFGATFGRQRGAISQGLLYDNQLSATDQLRQDAGGRMVDPEVRTNFADTALWLPDISLDANGKAQADITFPQSLTTWKLHGYALTGSTQVGDATAEATTTKNLLVRLQSPRFFTERDEVVLSANVHNYLKSSKKVRAELLVPASLFEGLGTQKTPDADGNVHLLAEKVVKADGETRFDWPVKVLKSGMARITVKALTNEESDAVRMAFPVLVHGIDKTVAQSGSYRVAQEGKRELQIALPAQTDPARTHLDITLSPSLAGVMVDALPYLTGYPYGCVEQTMSRFYPSVLVKDTLKKLGTDLETIGRQRKRGRAEDIEHRFGQPDKSPVFDSGELDSVVKAGLERIYNFQRPDGGWGWWKEDNSSPYQTAYVLQGLKAAMGAGVNVDRGIYSRGLEYLRNTIQNQLEKPKDEQDVGDLQTQAYVAYILSLEGELRTDEQRKWLDGLFEARGSLNNYGRSLLALAMQNFKKRDEAKLLLANVLQFVERDNSNETAWVRTPQQGWWFWWNNDIETNAWALKAMVAIEPQNELAPRIVKWLLNNRYGGYYWRSTRDTAQVISAMTDYMRASGEDSPDYTLTVNMDGKAVKEVKVDKTNFWTFDNHISLSGAEVLPGSHRITLEKKGTGALYYSTYLSYFTGEEDVRGAGNEIFVERQYFKLTPRPEKVTLPALGQRRTPAAGQSSGPNRIEMRDGYTRTPLQNGAGVKSGDLIEVVLNINAKNTYDYLAFEDMKPAGCEPVELRSGGRWAGGIVANAELRDEKVVFFVGLLQQGQHVLRYKVRAETPGVFHALPTKGFAMYAPEVKGISDEMRLQIRD